MWKKHLRGFLDLKNKKLLCSLGIYFIVSGLVAFTPEILAQTTEDVDGLKDLFEWLQKLIKYGMWAVGAGATLNFGYQLAIVQNMRAAGISGGAAALATVLGKKLTVSAII